MLDVTATAALEDCRGSLQHGLALWAALIWAAARLNQVPAVLTEDAPHGRTLEGVRFLNPFAAEFDPALLGGPAVSAPSGRQNPRWPG